MRKYNKDKKVRFQILFSADEYEYLKRRSSFFNISMSQYICLLLFNDKRQCIIDSGATVSNEVNLIE